MENRLYIKLFFIIGIILLASCSTATGTTIIQDTSDSKPINTTANTPSLTALPTRTSTPTITDTPTITPTPTPPPDLELTNVTILPNTYNVVDQDYYIMGRLRNNTKITMVLHDGSTILKMAFDRWEFDEQGKMPRGPYYHLLATGDLSAGEYHYNNYIIYPGEEGTIAFNMFDLLNLNDDVITDMAKYDGPLGITYTYQSSFTERPDLATGFHTKAENVTFQNKGNSIEFDFDVSIPLPPIFGISTELTEYIIFYDKNNKIIDIMQNNMNQYSGFEFGKKLHVHDSTANHKLFLDMTLDMAAQVDHLDIINEMVFAGM